ncbi:hypothetical protein [Sporosarcina sp. Marseille-Q4943]|uniref:hypothetical protein n=1 Tax=Sporosarcina sp. Marseille-Q4943 TaxID=2942204 RepID=UPI00208DAD51|nr:hypothetical protein [Sporosarcina sp. Marseille-Q4943]
MEDIEIKEMFKGQVHEHCKISVNVDGYDYSAIYLDGELNWFRPHPNLHMGEHQVKEIESKAYDKIKRNEEK